MADLYRKSALEKLNSPEQLNKVLTITSPMSWLALIGVTAIVVVGIIWSVVGSIPVMVTGKGVMASPTSTNAVYMEESGTAVTVTVQDGKPVRVGDTVLSYRTADRQVHELLSDQNGAVAGVQVKAGDSIHQGSEVIRISPEPTMDQKQVAVCYVKLAQAKRLQRGMENVQITVEGASAQTYGHMWGRVLNVDSHAATTPGMEHVLGAGNNLVNTFTNEGAVAAVTVELVPDGESGNGYAWTNAKGKTLEVSNGTPVEVRIPVETMRPIEKLFGRLKDIWRN